VGAVRSYTGLLHTACTEHDHRRRTERAGLREAGPAVTLLNDAGDPIAAVGIILLNPGCGAAWGYIGLEARSRPLPLVRKLRRLLALTMKRYNLQHVESLILPSFAAGPRWMKALGFKAIGTMNHPTLQKEFHRYVFHAA